jgi:tetratricopeptide (TPR) repeat protein
MEDVRSGLNVIRTLLKLGRFQQAANAYIGEFGDALLHNLEAHTVTLSVLRPMFPKGWDELPKDMTTKDAIFLAHYASAALNAHDEDKPVLTEMGSIVRAYFSERDWSNATVILHNSAAGLLRLNRVAQSVRMHTLALDLAISSEDKERIFMGRLNVFFCQALQGQWPEAAATWQLVSEMGRAWSRPAYRLGRAENDYAWFHFWRGTLQEEHFSAVEQLASKGKDRTIIRDLHRLRGVWRLERGEWALAAASYQEAVRLARERNLSDADSEIGLALAKHHLGQLPRPRDETERLAQLRNPAHRHLAMVWLAIGDSEQAKHHALAAYKWAWADGEPYVHRYELTKTTELLQQMSVPIPNLAPYDQAKEEPLPWEADVRAAIEMLRAEKQARPKK